LRWPASCTAARGTRRRGRVAADLLDLADLGGRFTRRAAARYTGHVPGRATVICSAALAVALAGRPATAQEQGDDSLPEAKETQPARKQPPSAPETSARDVAGAPRPDAARNLVHDDRSAARHLLWIPRAILFVPKWALWIAASPVRGGLYAFERHGLNERLRRLLSGDGPVAVYPSVARESGHGLTYGVGAGVRDHVRANFLFGGEVRQVYELRLMTDELLGPDLEIELAGQLHLLDDSLFFGIGNGDLTPAGMQTGIDARRDAIAVSTRFDQKIHRTELTSAWRPRSWVTARATGAFIAKDFETIDSGGPDRLDLSEVYDVDSLTAFEEGVRYGYGELRATYDDRITTNPYVSLAQPATGWKLEGFAGYAHGFADDPSRYLRYGLDVQRYFDLYRGDRILLLRAYLEGITSGLDHIPFSELPRVGGSRLVRGYARNRFRDRSATGFTLEYKFPVNRSFAAFVFLDGGGAWRKLSDFDPTELHPGYGGGVQLHTAELFVTRLLVGSGDDGVTFYLSFSPSSQLQLTTHQW
jgi:hypothetical protein